MNSTEAIATEDLVQRIPWDFRPESRETKVEVLRHFLEHEPSYQDRNGVTLNTHKFLFLYGVANTGKLQILKDVARDVFGQAWESRIYVRSDEGQKFPYKLHAHKVESSQKVIFVTDNIQTWSKWSQLYPGTRAIEFRGQENYISTGDTTLIRTSQYRTELHRQMNILQQEIKTSLISGLEEYNLSRDQALAILARFQTRFSTFHRMEEEAWEHSTVTPPRTS